VIISEVSISVNLSETHVVGVVIVPIVTPVDIAFCSISSVRTFILKLQS